METIKNYLDNMFSRLPRTQEIKTLKDDLLSNMEDKYEELKKEGKTENEAIGIVISEFGNIDELLNELNINTDYNIIDTHSNISKKNSIQDNYPLMKGNEVIDYLNIKKKAGKFISIGVFLCIIGVAILILSYQLLENQVIFKGLSENTVSTLPLIPLFILVVPAVALFISSGLKLEQYNFIEKGEFNLSNDTKFSLKEDYDFFRPKFTKGIILGVCLCVISPVSIFVGNMISESAAIYGLVILLFLVSIAVVLFINLGVMYESYKMLLKLDEYTPKHHKANNAISTVGSVVWPLTAALYLFISFVFNSWAISWIIFPIVGILFGAFTSIYKGIKKVS